MSLSYLLQTEEETRAATRRELAGEHDHVPIIIDTLFKLPHLIGQLESINTPKGEVQAYCSECYVTAPYTFWCLYDLYERGHYAEAVILLRHLLETFVQMRYFWEFPQKGVFS